MHISEPIHTLHLLSGNKYRCQWTFVADLVHTIGLTHFICVDGSLIYTLRYSLYRKCRLTGLIQIRPSRRPGLHGINMLELLKDQEIQSNEGWARTYIKWLLTWRCWGISYFNIRFNAAAGHQCLGWVHSQSMRDILVNGNGKLSFEETFSMLQYLLSKLWIFYFFCSW